MKDYIINISDADTDLNGLEGPMYRVFTFKSEEHYSWFLMRYT